LQLRDRAPSNSEQWVKDGVAEESAESEINLDDHAARCYGINKIIASLCWRHTLVVLMILLENR